MTERLAPSMSPDTQFFWDGATAHRLLVQRCAGCGELRHPPRPMCPHCNSLDWDAIESAGRATVLSFVMPRHPRYPWFDDDYIVALVELDEGFRLVTNLVGTTPTTTRTGMRVRVQFEEFDGGLVLPLFAPEEAS
ncbi:MAG: Zn-ribbon domain-containing OB-fold protein [Acidimicrobiia bacterium]